MDPPLALWAMWSTLTTEERASLETGRLFDATGVEVPIERDGVERDDPTTAASGVGALRYRPVAPLAEGWYTFQGVVTGSLAGRGAPPTATATLRSRFHVGSLPVLTQLRWCVGRSPGGELYVDFSEEVSTTGLETALAVEVTGGGRCSLGSITSAYLATVSYACADLAADAVVDVTATGSIVGRSGVPFALAATSSITFSLTDVPPLFDVGCVAVPATLADGIVAPPMSTP